MIDAVIQIPTEQLEKIVTKAIERLPETHREAIKNVGFFVMDQPSDLQLHNGDIHAGYTLLGLYEGVPLAMRQGQESTFPGRITIFQFPREESANSLPELTEMVYH